MKKSNGKSKRGPKSIATKVQTALEVNTRREMFVLLAEKVGQVSNIKETCDNLAKETGVKATPVAVRKMIRQGCKQGHVPKGSPLHIIARIPRGRPPGYSPKKAKAAQVTEEAQVAEAVTA